MFSNIRFAIPLSGKRLLLMRRLTLNSPFCKLRVLHLYLLSNYVYGHTVIWSKILDISVCNTIDNKMIIVHFFFSPHRWRASSDIYDNPSDINLQNVVESVAGEEWTHLLPPTHKYFLFFIH